MPFRPTVVCTGLPKHESILQPLYNTLSSNGCLHRAADDVHQNSNHAARSINQMLCFAFFCFALLSFALLCFLLLCLALLRFALLTTLGPKSVSVGTGLFCFASLSFLGCGVFEGMVV